MLRQLLLAAFIALMPSLVLAAPPSAEKDWSVTLGGGLGVMPEYSGSDDYEARFLPLLDVRYRDLAFLSTREGLGANLLRGEGYRAGVALTPNFGRDAGDSPRLRGMGDIDPTIEAGAFINYDIHQMGDGKFTSRASVRQDILDGHDGALVDLGLDYSHRFSPSLRASVGPSLNWGSENYMQRFYGVNASQAQRSGLRNYSAGSGFYQAGIGGSVTYSFTPNWSITPTASYRELLGDAADSPLSTNDSQFFGGVVMGYRF